MNRLPPEAERQLERLPPELRAAVASAYPSEARERFVQREREVESQRAARERDERRQRLAARAISGDMGLEVRKAVEHIYAQCGQEWTDDALNGVERVVYAAGRGR